MNDTPLSQRHCVPCKKGGKPLPRNVCEDFLESLPQWKLNLNATKVTREFAFPNFEAALHFVNRIGDIAEMENHHPDIELSWGKVLVNLWTHKVGGLSENDFILAAKIDELLVY